MKESRSALATLPDEPDGSVFRRTFEHAPVGMTLSSIDGRMVRVNRTFCEMTGYAEAEAVGRRFQDLTHPEDLPRELLLLQRVLHGEQTSYRIEKRLLTKGGHIIWVQRSLSLERDAEGAPEFLLSVVVDITARKAAELALQRSTTQLNTAQRVARIGSWELDLTTNALVWSDEIYRIFELDPSKFAASYATFLERVHPGDRLQVDAAYQASVRERSAYEIAHRLLLADGRIKFVRETGETFYGETGKPIRSVGTVQDISEQKFTELGLQDRELRLSSILTSIRDLVALFRVEANAIRIIEINPTGLRQLQRFLPGVTASSISELDLEVVAHQLGHRLPVPANLRKVLTSVVTGGQAREFERKSNPEPGVVLHSEITLTPVPTEGGPHHLVLMVSRDVTERKKAERLLRSSLVEKETLLSEVHHRVKNNLQIISSMLSLQSSEGDALTRGLLDEARNRIHTMALVHEQLYRTHDFASIDLAEHIQSLATMVAQSQLRREGITLCCTLESVSLSLEQAIPLGLVLNELLSNAYKHAFAGRAEGTVRVTCAREGTAVRVQVADDGVGLSAEQTVAGARTLGLRLVRTLLAQLRASLTIERGPGTRVIIVVPTEGDPR